MNNDNNTTSSVVVGCSSITTTATASSGAAAGGAAAMNANDSGSSLSLIAGHSTTTISTTSPSIYTSASAAKSAGVPTTGRNEDKTKKPEFWEESKLLKELDICRFKHLLEEAYSYKNPRDKENKSEAFLQLLQKAENEKEDTKYAFSALTSRYTRNTTSNSQKQGGSLQDLVEAVRPESQDFDYTCGSNRNRRHNHNSRPKKYSSVSSRQREGGSLPSNVNVSNCSLSVYEQPFMNEEKTKQRRTKNEVRVVANNTSNTTDLLALPTTRGSGTGGGGSVGIGRTSPAIVGTGNSVISGNNYTASAAAQLCGGVAEISLTTNPCTALRKGDHPAGSGCGSACEGGAIGAISLAATIGNSTSATCAALATATAVVSDCGDTVIEMNENYIDQHTELLSQGIQFDRIDGIEKKIPRANIIGSVLTRSDFSPNNTTCYVDEAVHFTTLDRGKSTVDASYIPLDENYKACKSVLGEKSELVKMQSFSATKTISKQFDENGNSLNTTYTTSQSQAKAKKKKSQSERNTKTLDLQSFEGYRGFDPIEVLVKYIESSEDTKQNDKVSKIGDSSSSNKKKDRKKDKEKEKDKEKGKMKRSNSLEELRSCSKLDGDDVTMRNKSNAKNKTTTTTTTTSTSTSTVEVKDKQPTPSANTGANRKGERRSWGTEELTYLGENNAIAMEDVREKVKDKEKKKSRDKDRDTADKADKVVDKRKKSDANLVVSMESISCESAEFHVVTKKKKPKKQRQAAEDGKNNNSGGQQKNQMHQNRKYHSNFSNDREAYINSLNSNNSNDKSRRKSTSSMPPSEKSDSSDLDSVHSLPIESAGGRSPLQAHHHHQNQPRSYAEIARKTEASGAVVSPGGIGGATTLATIDSNTSNTSSNNSSHTELEINAVTVLPTVNTSSKKSKKSLKTDFPELISNDGGGGTNCNSTTNNAIATNKQISYSQSLTSASKSDEVVVPEQTTPPKTVPYTVDVIKSAEKHPQQSLQQQMPQQQLQKSKSMETECFYKSIDQYPALEKTVKRHSTTNTGVAGEIGVTAIPPPAGVVPVHIHAANISCIAIANTAPVSKKSKANTKVIEEVLVAEPHTHPHPHPHLHPHSHPTTMISMPSTGVVAAATMTTTAAAATSKKSRKDKSTESFPPVTQYSPSATSYTASNINNKNQIHHNHPNYHLNSNTNIKSSSNNSHISNTSSSNKFSSRPAVIILNDDTTACGLSSCIGNEFTFGDFNEEELRLFDESQPAPPLQKQQQQPQPQLLPLPTPEVIPQKRYTATVVSSLHNFDDSGSNFNASDMANNSDDVMLLMQHTSSPNSSLVIDQSSDSGIYSNYEGVKMGRKTMVSAVPAAALVNPHNTVSHRSSSTENTKSSNAIQSSVSTSPSKESLSSASTTSSSSSASSSATPSSTSTYVENVPASLLTAAGASSTSSATGKTLKSTVSPNLQQSQPQHQQNQLDSKNKSTQSNLCNIKVPTMNKRSSQQQQQQQQSSSAAASALLSQQLETCDDIETAIIAAAKKAAAVAAEQSTAISKAYNTKSSSNSLPMMGSTTSANIPQLSNSNTDNTTTTIPLSSCYGHSKGVTSPPPQSSSSSSSSSISKDYTRRAISVGAGVGPIYSEAAGIGGALLQQHRKEIDVHFIPPTLATPISSIQNNETIINFIGSAWEEVANSKVTQFYDGQ